MNKIFLIFLVKENFGSPETAEIVSAEMNESFFAEMELKAKLLKRVAKSGKNKEETDRLLGVEEVFKTCKEIAKLQIDNVSKIMTLRRLAIDEEKNGSHVT